MKNIKSDADISINELLAHIRETQIEIENKNLYQRLNIASKLILNVPKDKTNAHQNYGYVSHDIVSLLVKEVFNKTGIISIPSDLEWSRNGNSTTLKMSIDLINIDNPEDHREIISWGEGVDPQDKGIGKAKSYALKYAYLKVLCLPTGLDPEQDSISRTNADVRPQIDREAFIREIKEKAIELGSQKNLTDYMKEKQIHSLEEAPDDFLILVLHKLKLKMGR